jgi:hypothetical protein
MPPTDLSSPIFSTCAVMHRSDTFTLIERKPRMPQIQGVEGEAVVNYCEPLTTKEMGYHRLSPKVNKMKL